jgi:hypothetical protein
MTNILDSYSNTPLCYEPSSVFSVLYFIQRFYNTHILYI